VDASSLAEQRIAVAGAAGGLGPTVVAHLVRAGATVALAGRDLNALKQTAVGAGAPRADVESVDLLDETATRRWVERLAMKGDVQGLVHLVGGWRGGTAIEDAPADDWDAMSSLLVRTTQTVARAFLPHLLASHGRFVIISSGQAQAPTHTNAAYAAAKAAAETWTLALADRFRGSGATANIIVVGAIVTPAMRAGEPDESFAGFTPAEEIADATVYLCSDAAASINGQRLTLRGA
jgi:NAD(P)-dependent dehydrogenase (short-subunit alcohol dehydrogenase family)